jgi:hypothetical protein
MRRRDCVANGAQGPEAATLAGSAMTAKWCAPLRSKSTEPTPQAAPKPVARPVENTPHSPSSPASAVSPTPFSLPSMPSPVEDAPSIPNPPEPTPHAMSSPVDNAPFAPSPAVPPHEAPHTPPSSPGSPASICPPCRALLKALLLFLAHGYINGTIDLRFHREYGLEILLESGVHGAGFYLTNFMALCETGSRFVMSLQAAADKVGIFTWEISSTSVGELAYVGAVCSALFDRVQIYSYCQYTPPGDADVYMGLDELTVIHDTA